MRLSPETRKPTTGADGWADRAEQIFPSDPSAQEGLRVSGFQDKGAIWKGKELYYFSIPTGIRHQAHADHADHPNIFRVVYPDGTLSADCYNLARTQQHCRDLARAIYPRQSAATSALSENNVAGAPGKAVHSSFGPGRHSPTPPSLRKPSPSEASS